MTEKQSLKEKLTTAVTDLVWLSEADYPFKVIDWQIETIDSIILLEKLNRPQHTKVKVIELETFFATATQEKDWYGDRELTEVKRYRDLIEILVTNLQEIKVYRVGEIEIDIYILGKTALKTIAGLTTTVIET